MTTFPSAFDDDERTLVEKVEKLQAGLIGCATQDGGDLDAFTYERLRLELLNNPTIRAKIPEIVRKYRDGASSGSSSKTSLLAMEERAELGPNKLPPLTVIGATPGARSIYRLRFEVCQSKRNDQRRLCGKAPPRSRQSARASNRSASRSKAPSVATVRAVAAKRRYFSASSRNWATDRVDGGMEISAGMDHGSPAYERERGRVSQPLTLGRDANDPLT